MLLLTPDAAASRWVRSETDVAVELEHEEEMRSLPVLVKVCKLPALWRTYQRISFMRRGYEAGLITLMAALDGEWSGGKIDDSRLKREKPTPTVRRQKKDSFIHEKTGLEFVRVPAGEFLYGKKKEKKRLDEFWISKTPVTNAVYAKFVEEFGQFMVDIEKNLKHWQNGKLPADKLDHPVVYVSWDDAATFANWAGLRLPTEEEWEKAARGTDGREYPWGNEEPTPFRCNYGKNMKGTTPVGRYSPQGDSLYGCVDMAGNVWEWTDSWYDDEKAERVVRGGSWFSYRYGARAAFRGGLSPGSRDYNLGFRLVAARRSPSHQDR